MEANAVVRSGSLEGGEPKTLTLEPAPSDSTSPYRMFRLFNNRRAVQAIDQNGGTYSLVEEEEDIQSLWTGDNERIFYTTSDNTVCFQQYIVLMSF